MTDIVAGSAGQRSLVPSGPDPPLSPALSSLVDAVALHGDAALVWMTRATGNEAGAVLPQWAAHEQPASPVEIRLWLDLIQLGVAHPLDDARFEGRAMLIADTSGDLPACCWTAETRRAFVRRGEVAKFFPSEAEVDLFLRPIAARVWAKRRALRRIWERVRSGDDAHEVELTPREREENVVRFRRDYEAMRGEQIRHELQSGAVIGLRPVHLVGEALWNKRNRMRADVGMPPFPRPDSFDGYGVIP